MAVTVTYERKRIRCGKPRCRCNTPDENQWHGPYWYAFWRDPKTGKTRARYVGKHFTPPAAGTGAHSKARSEHVDAPPSREKTARTRARAHEERARSKRRPGAEQREQQHHAPPPRDQDTRDAELLGVDRNVTQDALKKAWRRKMAAHHPDRFQGTERAHQEEAAKRINEAYQRMLRRRGWKR